jgi:hypothetical protein
MVRHEAVRKNRYCETIGSDCDQPLECGEIAGGLKKDAAFCGSIEYVKNEARGSVASSSWHAASDEATSMPQRDRDRSVLFK